MRSAVIILAAITSTLVACVDEPTTGQTAQNALTRNRIAVNRIAVNRIAVNRIAVNKLAAAALSRDRLEVQMPEASDLLATADGRDVYSYLVSCAAPSNVTLEIDLPGATDTAPDDPYTCTDGHCVFPGGVGLAPRWLRHRLTTSEAEWVSACMFARVNAHDTAEAISLRGEDRALVVSEDEAARYTVEEGAFYGNLFTGEDEPIAWFSCEGEGQASGEFGGLVERDCTEPMACAADHTCDANPSCVGADCQPLACGDDGYCHDATVDGDPVISQCGFTWTGTCADYTPQYPSAYACREFDACGGYYGGCHDAPGAGRWPHAKQWDRVITTYVTP